MAQVEHLSLNGQDYDIGAYIAAPDDSCRGVIAKIQFGFSTEYLTEKIKPMGPEGPRVLNARMMASLIRRSSHSKKSRFHASYASEWWNAGANPTFPRNRFAMSALG
ncbi:hypothetical protein HPB47_022750 [Ixodes persulcatus]|uniref:Uncharacterized protein n=1 Tax=Ixodes persulcatus TaxID=34615 RepID=A0AC60Q8V4_IXOPE|nr:hypothetical protein HPB47_022750 [Ixodes persulcatus]